MRLIVADQGEGQAEGAPQGGGFGSRMIDSLVKQLEGRIEHLPNEPGLRVVVTAPIQPASSS